MPQNPSLDDPLLVSASAEVPPVDEDEEPLASPVEVEDAVPQVELPPAVAPELLVSPASDVVGAGADVQAASSATSMKMFFLGMARR